MKAEETGGQKFTLEGLLTQKHIEDFTESISRQPLLVEPGRGVEREFGRIEMHRIEEGSDCMCGQEFEGFFLYALGRNHRQNSEVLLYTFRKKDGQQCKTTLGPFNGHITCLRLQLCIGASFEQIRADGKNVKFKLLVGTAEGFLKVADLEAPHFFNKVQLDCKPVVALLEGDYLRFKRHNVCLALTEDSQIFFVDLNRYEVVYIFKPQIIMCDAGLSLGLHMDGRHLLQATRGGYLVLWDVDPVLAYLESKEGKKGKGREYSTFPKLCDHTAAIEGLLWVSFYGDLLALITQEGVLKIVAYLFGNEVEFMELVRFFLGEPGEISHAEIFP
jgi:hypothetical protein